MSARDELILDLAKILAPAPKTRRILHITEDREIDIDAPKLADAILAAGYTRTPTAPLKRVRGELKSLGKHVDSWESEGHTTVTLRFMRQWIARIEDMARDKA